MINVDNNLLYRFADDVYTPAIAQGAVVPAAAAPLLPSASGVHKVEAPKKEGKRNVDEDKSELVKKPLEQRLGDAVVRCMQEMCAENITRINGYKKQISLLNKGVFYMNEYLQALQQLAKDQSLQPKTRELIQQRLKTMIDKGSFYHGAAPLNFYQYEADASSPTGIAIVKYLLKDSSVTPSAALNAILEGSDKPTFIACGEACQIPFYKALQEALGEKFDALFAYDAPTPLSIGMAANNLLNPIYLLTEDMVPSRPLMKGDWVYIQGPDIYPMKHINGEGANWNVVCFDPEKGKAVYGGLGFGREGVTHSAIEETFLSEFNEDPVGFEGMTEEVALRMKSGYPPAMLEQAEKIKHLEITMKQLRDRGGGKIFLIRRLNQKRIQQLIDATPEEGRKLLASWKSEQQKKVDLYQSK